MYKKIFYGLLFILLFSTKSYAADIINKGDVLNLDQCIDIALQRHPYLNAASGSVRVLESKIGQARANYYPQLTFQSSYQRIGPAASSLLRSDPYNSYSNTLNLSQNIFDFGKTATQVEIQSLGKESSLADLQDVRGLVIFNVKQFYFGFLQGKMSRDVARETANQFQQHYERSKVFFETGKSSKIDVTSAEVNLSNARINLLKAENALRIAKVNLNNAMGMTNAPDYEITDELTYRPDEIFLEDALQNAYKNRPDLLSLNKKKEGLEKTIALNKKGYLPVLSGNAAYGYTGDDLSMEKAWNVGVTLTFPLFSGLSTKYQIDEARANLDVLLANEDTLKQKISLEVESAYLSMKEAEQRISAGKIVVRQAEENVELAQGRYTAGVGSYMEITDAVISLNNAKMTYITALSDYSVTRAGLQKAMGVNK
ncbi:MAG: TolC family protein [Deltaproteobacteria bacterium HGW-Deltaproteobacteria-12]|jgi:outer membrane protein TolC|nr:MAG: TolC family protein [Deltaproteobacteria bacterium HGW-Deltaproteobacteria-12]